MPVYSAVPSARYAMSQCAVPVPVASPSTVCSTVARVTLRPSGPSQSGSSSQLPTVNVAWMAMSCPPMRVLTMTPHRAGQTHVSGPSDSVSIM